MKKWLGFFHNWLLPVLLLFICTGVCYNTMPSSNSDYHKVRLKSSNQLITKNSFNDDNNYVKQPLIYVATFDGKLYAISYETGALVWKLTNKFQMYVEAEYFRSNFNENIHFSNNERMDGDPNKNVSSSKFHTDYTVDNEYIVPSVDGTLYQFKNNQYRIVTDVKKDFLDDSTSSSSSSSSSNFIRSTATLKLIGVDPWSGEIIYECNGSECSYPQFLDSDNAKDFTSSNKHHHHHMNANKNTPPSSHLLVVEAQMYHRFNTNLKHGYINWNMSHNNIQLRYIDKTVNEYNSYDDTTSQNANEDSTNNELNCPEPDREHKLELNHTHNVIKHIRYDALHDVLENTHNNWKLHINSPIVGIWSLSQVCGLVELNLRSLLYIPNVNEVISGISDSNDLNCCDHSLLLFSFRGQPYFVPIVGIDNQNKYKTNLNNTQQYRVSIYSITEFKSEETHTNENDLSAYDIKTLGLFDAYTPIEKVSLNSDPGCHVYDKDRYFYKLLPYGSFSHIDSNGGNNKTTSLQLLHTPFHEQKTETNETSSDEGWVYFFSDTIPYYYGKAASIIKNCCVIGSLVTVFYNSLYFGIRKLFEHFSRMPESSPLTIRKGYTTSNLEADITSWDFTGNDEPKNNPSESNRISDHGGTTPKISTTESKSLSNSLNPQHTISRYMTDFKHIKKLGKGGFGHVYMAKNLIDECEYAIKRIRMPECSGARVRVMREVQALAKLNHPGVVRFYNAWFEPTITTFDEVKNKPKVITLCPTLQNDSDLSLDSDEDYYEHSRSSCRGAARRRKSSSFKVDFNNPFVIPEDAIPSVSSSTHDESNGSYPASSLEKECRVDEHHSSECTHSLNTDLYIQMQLCQSQTLHDWLETNTSDRNISTCINYFKQILMAIGYIHSQDFIHRDLKPSNIFFSMDGVVKIGDFGLVAHTLPAPKSHEVVRKQPRKSKNSRISVSICSDNINLHYYTKLVGTRLYMAPEQSNCEKYDNTVDVYALALILTELVLPFKTQSERCITLCNMKELKKNTELAEKYPTVSLLVGWMLAVDPKNRPTAADILGSDLIQSLWSKYGV